MTLGGLVVLALATVSLHAQQPVLTDQDEGAVPIVECDAYTPYDVSAFVHRMGTAKIKWKVQVKFDGDIGFEVFWRIQGEADWNKSRTWNRNTFLRDLDHGSWYELKVRAVCLNTQEMTPFSETITFACPLREALEPEDVIQVFPNPTNGPLTVQVRSSLANECLINVLDISGKLVMTSTMALDNGTGTWQTDLSHALPGGIYFVQVKAGEDVVTRKLALTGNN